MAGITVPYVKWDVPFLFESEHLAAGANPIYDPTDGISASTYDWGKREWARADVSSALVETPIWRAKMAELVLPARASFMVARALKTRLDQWEGSFGVARIPWRESAGGIEFGILLTEERPTWHPSGPPPWLTTYALTEAGLHEAWLAARVGDVMEA